MHTALQVAKNHNVVLVILIGDEGYCGRFGFKNAQYGRIGMSAPVKSRRLLALELREGALKTVRDKARCYPHY
ncbi:hypothetical protein [Bartonella australis]|uniref:hypothetical protein n=1 Tax=Bartonella australis TaxID=388640 RepID=UPI00034DA891|nr:hypothetical protein [Bartonella australis]